MLKWRHGVRSRNKILQKYFYLRRLCFLLLKHHPDYIYALDSTSVDAMGIWSTHAWGGDAGIGEPDIGAEAAKTVTLVDEGGGSYSLEVTLAAGSTLTVVLSLEGDITVDGFVDNFDLAVIAERWLDESCGECGAADISGDEKVDMKDFAGVGADWLFN